MPLRPPLLSCNTYRISSFRSSLFMKTRIFSFLIGSVLSISSIPSALAEVGAGADVSGASSIVVGDTVDVDMSGEANADAEFSGTEGSGRIARCKHLLGHRKERCLRLVNSRAHTREDSGVRADARAGRSKFKRSVRRDDDDSQKGNHKVWGDLQKQLNDFFAQIRAAMQTEMGTALTVCDDKEGAERDQCLLEASVNLRARVKVMLDAALNAR